MTTADLFAADGPLAAQLSGYAPRSVQVAMAEAVAAAIETDDRLVVEADTGTGKTLAYLLPALAAGGKVIVSTATRHLQEQIYANDIPLVTAALGVRPRVRLLKGRANYLCRHRLALTEAGGDLRSPALRARLRGVRDWSMRTRTGDLSEIGDIDDGSPLWPRVSSTVDNCLGTECPEFEDCWVVAARRAAQAAEVVIVNHHLLFADLTLREQGFGELLPGADTVILDEAHRLPDIAGQFFGHSLSSRRVRDVIRDGHAEALAAGGDMPDLTAALEELGAAEATVNDCFAQSDSTLAWRAFVARRGAEAAAGQLVAALNGLADALAEVAERADALAALGHRVAELGERGEALLRESEAEVRWVERRGSGWFWHATPLDVAAPFERALQAHTGSWVFTSATLSVNGSLDYFAGRLGLNDATQHLFDSPFDYRNNSLLYLPASMPLPSDGGFDAAFAGQVLGLVEASQGGAFVLCTSFRSLHAVAGRLRQAGVGPLLVQGEQGRAALLSEFRDHGDAVLVGTGSFWEGVDVRGPALRLVIIDRLPFASPSDPVLAARVDAMRQRGEAPFPDYQVPQAVIALKQGVGRLIRDHADRGLLAICDPRLTSKGYGRIFLSSLPDLPVTRSRDDAEAFLRAAVPA